MQGCRLRRLTCPEAREGCPCIHQGPGLLSDLRSRCKPQALVERHRRGNPENELHAYRSHEMHSLAVRWADASAGSRVEEFTNAREGEFGCLCARAATLHPVCHASRRLAPPVVRLRPEPCYSTAFVSQHQDLLAEVGPAQHVIHAKLHAQLLVAERHRVVGQAGVAAGIVEL
jgi:hypothetical protein